MTLDIFEVTADSELHVLEALVGLLANHASGRLDEREVGEALVEALEDGTPARFFISYRDDGMGRRIAAVAVAGNLCTSILTPGRHLVVDHVAIARDTIDVRLCSEILEWVMAWAAQNRCRYVSTTLDRADIVSQALFASSGFGLAQNIVHMDATVFAAQTVDPQQAASG